MGRKEFFAAHRKRVSMAAELLAVVEVTVDPTNSLLLGMDLRTPRVGHPGRIVRNPKVIQEINQNQDHFRGWRSTAQSRNSASGRD
jgi:hypothetical protein